MPNPRLYASVVHSARGLTTRVWSTRTSHADMAAAQAAATHIIDLFCGEAPAVTRSAGTICQSIDARATLRDGSDVLAVLTIDPAPADW